MSVNIGLSALLVFSGERLNPGILSDSPNVAQFVSETGRSSRHQNAFHNFPLLLFVAVLLTQCLKNQTDLDSEGYT